jgi:uncharacterized protein YdeI (YjbR/CyaY-like superfamily)
MMDEAKKNPWDKTNQWSEELDVIKTIIAQTELEEMTKWGGPVYTINGKNVVGVGGFKSYVGLWFFNGVFMKDEKKVLVNAQEGVTKALRQWRFSSKEEILQQEKLILMYLNEAIANEKAGISKKPEKKEAIISDLLNSEFKKNPCLAKAFSVFSPYKQREFLEYVETAKQEKTKLARIEKIKPLILKGIGLNDKYR